MSTKTLWLSPTDWVSGDPALRINYPSAAHPATEITATAPGDLKWVFTSLRLPSAILIKTIQVCYQLSNRRSFISQVRLEEMLAPDRALVRHDDPTDLLNTVPTCYVSRVGAYRPEGAVTLALRLNFANPNDKITLGSVGVEVEDCEIEVANVKCFGAVGDGVADDTTSIQNAIDAVEAAGGGVVYFPNGAYLTSQPLRVRGNSVALHGVGREVAIVKNASSDVLQISDTSGVRNFILEDLQLESLAGGGHVIVVPFGMSQSTIRAARLVQRNNDKSIYRLINTATTEGGGGYNNLVTETWLQGPPTPAVQQWHVEVNGARYNANMFERVRCDNSGAFFFHLESIRPQAPLSGNSFRDLTFEHCVGGKIKLLSCVGTLLQDCVAYDDHVAPITNHGFYVGRSPSSTSPSTYTTLINCDRRNGELNGFKDIKLAPAECLATTVINCSGTRGAGITHDFGGTPVTAMGMSAFVALEGTAQTTIISSSEVSAPKLRSAAAPAVDVTHHNYGAVGDGVADDTAAIVAANAFAATNGGSVYFPPGTYRVAANTALTQPTIFEARALLKPEAGATVTISGAITALPEAIFDAAAGGAFSVIGDGEVYANWWTGADFSQRFNHCRNSIDLTLNSTTGPRVIKVLGRHVCCGSLNLTMIRRPLTIDFSQAQLIFAMAGGVAVDCTGSWQLTLIDPWLIGDACATPDIGLLHARNQAVRPENPPSAGRHSIWRPRVEGAWNRAAYYNIGSEANQHWGGEYTNMSQTAKYVAFLTKKNIHGITSAFAGVIPGNGTPCETTATGQEFFGTQFRGRDIPNSEDAGVFVIYGFSNVASYASFFVSSIAPHVLIDHTEFGILTLELIGIFTHGGLDEGETRRPTASIKTIGDLENPLRKIRVSARKITATEAAFDIGRSKLLAPELTWSEKEGLRSHPDSLMSGAMIRVPSNLATPIQLGGTFQGEIYCGPASTVDYAQTTVSNRATIFASDGVLQFNQAKLPARGGTPGVDPGQAIVWLSNGAPANSDDGDLMVTIADTAGTVKTIKLVDFSEV